MGPQVSLRRETKLAKLKARRKVMMGLRRVKLEATRRVRQSSRQKMRTGSPLKREKDRRTGSTCWKAVWMSWRSS